MQTPAKRHKLEREKFRLNEENNFYCEGEQTLKEAPRKVVDLQPWSCSELGWMWRRAASLRQSYSGAGGCAS